MIVETVKISTLKPDPDNVRRHDAANLDAIKRSLKEFGQQKPIVIGKDNVVIAGNGFLAAAIELGWKTVNVVRTNLYGAKARAFAIADNRTAELSEWDMDALKAMLKSLPDDYAQSTGWSDEEIAALGSQVDDAYRPMLTPEFANGMVTGTDMERAQGVFDVAKRENARIPITCPHCGEDFEIDRPN